MSAPEPVVLPPGVTPLPSPLHLVQVAAWRGGESALAVRLRAAGWELPQFGHAWFGSGRIACSVRPQRWLLIDEGDGESNLEASVGDAGAVTDLGAARCAWRIADPSAREWLAAGCRLDLHPQAFPPGRAAVTLVAQVPVMLLAESASWLLYAPSSMARHVAEWLGHAAGSVQPRQG